MTDPAHPLFGRDFQIASLPDRERGSSRLFVHYRDGIVLALPLHVTNLAPLENATPNCKLSLAAIHDFLALVKEYELWPTPPPPPTPSGTNSQRQSKKRSSKN